MILEKICERIQREFSDVRIVEIVEDLNDIQKDFVIETEILKTTGNLTIVANTVTYTLLTEFSTLDKVLRVDFLDSTLKMDIKPNGTITFYDYYGDAITEIPSGITTIRFYYTYHPATLSSGTLSATPDIPSQLHEALVYGELARLHSIMPTLVKTFQDGSTAKIKDFQSLQFNEMKYREFIIKAKKIANTEKSDLGIFIKADQF